MLEGFEIAEFNRSDPDSHLVLSILCSYGDAQMDLRSVFNVRPELLPPKRPQTAPWILSSANGTASGRYSRSASSRKMPRRFTSESARTPDASALFVWDGIVVVSYQFRESWPSRGHPIVKMKLGVYISAPRSPVSRDKLLGVAAATLSNPVSVPGVCS